MAQGPIRMSRAARVGLFALVVALIAGAGIYVAIKTRSTGGYRMGVHFRTAAGIAPGAQVFFNGVHIGNVSKVKILPDTTIEVIVSVFHATDIPRNAKFTIQSTFTGSPTIAILVPKQRVAQNEAPTPLPPGDLLPKRIVPVQEQPVGSTPLSIEDVMGQAKALGDRAQHVLAVARPYGGRLIGRLQSARANGAASSRELRAAFPAIVGSMQTTIAKAKANAANAQVALRERDQRKLAAIALAFKRSASDMSNVSGELGSLKNDPQIHANVQASAAQLHAVTANMAALSHEMAGIAKNPQTKAQLQDAGARFREALRRLKSLLP